MALISEAFPLRYKGEDAQLHVIRNDGFCWGRLVLRNGEEMDVFDNDTDWYDYPDEDAAEGLEQAALRGNVEPPMASWTIGWEEVR